MTKGNKETSPDLIGPVDDHGLQKVTKQLIVKVNNMEFLREDKKENPECVICFLGIYNMQGEEIPGLTEAVKRQFYETTSYRFIEKSEIERGLEVSKIKRNDIFIPEERDKFVAALDRPFQYFLSGQVVSSPIQDPVPGQLAGDNIVLDLVSVRDDAKAIVQDRLASLYNDAPRKKVWGLF